MIAIIFYNILLGNEVCKREANLVEFADEEFAVVNLMSAPVLLSIGSLGGSVSLHCRRLVVAGALNSLRGLFDRSFFSK